MKSPHMLVISPSVLFRKGAEDLINQNGMNPSGQIGHRETLDI